MRTSNLIILALFMYVQTAWGASSSYTIGSLDEKNGEKAYFSAAAAAGEAQNKAAASYSALPVFTQIIVVETPKTGIRTIAVFSSKNGGFEATEGDTIPGGYLVKKIDSVGNRVQLQKDNKVRWVNFRHGEIDNGGKW